MEPEKKRSKKSSNKTKVRSVESISTETLKEEQAYQKKVQWLKDHGDSDKDELVKEKKSSSTQD